MEQTTVEWHNIDGYPGYWICEDGRVLSTRQGKDKLLSVWIHKSNAKNYLRTTLYKDGKRKKLMVHILVAQAFVLNPYPALFKAVHHKDDNTLNPHKTNLEWCTQEYNEQQKRR